VKKFLVLYRSSVSAMQQMTTMSPEAAKASMDAWVAWFGKAGAGIVEMGAPIGESSVLKGKPGEGFVGGYSIVQADSMGTAKKMLESHPHFEAPAASIELLEILPMPGM
jgi:hypothetical protein